MAVAGIPVDTIQASILIVVWGLLLGLLTLVAGYIVALIIEKILRASFKKAQVEQKLSQLKLQNAIPGFTFSGLITGLVKWTVFLWFVTWSVSLIESSLQVTGLGVKPVLTTFMTDFTTFLPTLLQAILVLLVGFLLADYLATKVRAGLKVQSKTISAAVKVIVVYFSLITALSMLSIPVDAITNIFNNLVQALSWGLGAGLALALGLGLKDSVARISKKHEVAFERSVVNTARKR